jgi:septal ring factor EnvC (AmiA/AmiB activator)
VRRASLLLIALAATAHADDDAEPTAQATTVAAESSDARTALADQLAAEAATLAKTIATVDDKLAAADETRLHRLRAAMRILHAPLRADASADERFAAARRRAAARLLLLRDANERGLLADEAQHLKTAQTTEAEAVTKLPSIPLPGQLARPVKGSIARHFGIYQHDRAHVTLSRRGLDFEVEDHAPTIAPAEGVVRYAGAIRGLDHGVLLDCGNYYVLVAKLGDLAIPVGARVHQGDRLGLAQRHRVYLEVRVKLGPGGLPIDPEPLLEPVDRARPRP